MLFSGPRTQFWLGQTPRTATWMIVPAPRPCCPDQAPWASPWGHWNKVTAAFLCFPPRHCMKGRPSAERETAALRFTAPGSMFQCMEHRTLTEITYLAERGSLPTEEHFLLCCHVSHNWYHSQHMAFFCFQTIPYHLQFHTLLLSSSLSSLFLLHLPPCHLPL